MNLRPDYYRKTWWCIVIIGSLLVGMATSAVQLFQQHKTAVVVVWYIVLMLVWCAFNAHWMRKFMDYLRSLEPLRTIDPDSYRSSIRQLLQWNHSKQVTAILQISLANADCEQWDFAAAKQTMEDIQPDKIHGMVRLCYWLNMTYILFHLGETEQAKQLWVAHKEKLLPFEKNSEWGFCVQTVKFFDLFYLGEREDAEQLYAQMQQEKENTPHYDQKEMEYLNTLIQGCNIQCK